MQFVFFFICYQQVNPNFDHGASSIHRLTLAASPFASNVASSTTISALLFSHSAQLSFKQGVFLPLPLSMTAHLR
jgi:hypothetical protein